MRKNLQGSHSLCFSVPGLLVWLVLISLVASALGTSAAFSQSITPTGVYKYYLPLIRTADPTPVGPVGGTFTSFAIDPGQNDNIYAGHFGSGVYKSFDQGTTWYRKNVGLGSLTIQSLAAHPISSSIVFAGTYGKGIYKSTNAGESWRASNGGVLNNHIIYDIEIDPANPQRMFVVSRISGSLKGYLSRSMDGGLNWAILLTGSSFPTLDYFYDVDIDLTNPTAVYLTAHEHGFFKSVNGGVSFSPINSGVTDFSARSFAIDSAYAGLVYGAVWHGDGIYRTWNGGAAWAKSSVGLPVGVRLTRVTLDPFGRQQKRVFSCTYGNGLYSSDDFASSWVSRGLAGQRLYDFVIADGIPQRWYAATENNGIFRSTSYGSNWKSIMADLRLTAITGLEELPGEPAALAGAVFGQGIFRISDAGETWEPINEGLTNLDVVSLVVAHEELYALGRGWMNVWDGEIWQPVGLPEASQEAVDNGRIWVAKRVLLPDEAFGIDLINQVQPSSVAWQDGGLLVGTAGSGLWVMKGDQWEQAGLDGWVIQNIKSVSENEAELFACDRTGECAVLNFDSTDLNERAGSWDIDVDSSVGLPPLSIEVGGSNSADLLTAVSQADNCAWAVAEQIKVWVTKDCGRNWTAHSFDWTVQALAFDPLDANFLLVGTRESGAFRIQVP